MPHSTAAAAPGTTSPTASCEACKIIVTQFYAFQARHPALASFSGNVVYWQVMPHATCQTELSSPPPPFRSPSIRQLVMRVQEQQRCLLRRLPAFGTFNRIQQPPCAGACPLYLSVCVCVSVCLHLSATRNCLFKGFHTHTHTLAHMCLVLFRYVTFLLLFLLFPCFPARSGILSPTHLGRLLCLSTFAIFFCFCFYFSFLYSTPCLFLFN